MQKRNAVEEDLQWGPLKMKDIFFKKYSSRDEVHILVKVYKYRVFVGQFDTTSEVWDVVGEAFHSIEVEVARYWFDRKFKTKSEDEVIEIIEKHFPGPNTIESFCAICRECGTDFSIHEGGPVSNDLIKKFESSAN